MSYPAGRYLLRNRPRNCVCEGPSLYFRSAASDSAPGRLSIAETYRVTNKRIDPGSYQDVLNFYNEVQKHQSEKIIFSKKI